MPIKGFDRNLPTMKAFVDQTATSNEGGTHLTSARNPETRLAAEKLFAPAKGQLPPPEVLALYAAIDPEYPTFLRQTFIVELRRNFIYQVLAMCIAAFFASLMVAASTFLIYTGHPKMAGVIIGANALAFAGKILAKSRRGD